MALRGTYHDGETAARQAAVLRPDRVAGLLRIEAETGATLAEWPFGDIREIRDHGHARAMVAHVPGSEARLVIEGATAISDFRALAPGLRKITVNRSQLGRVVKWGGGALAAMALLLFVIIPGLADQLARWIPPDSEVAFGRTIAKHFGGMLAGEGQTGYCTTPEGTAALARLTGELGTGAVLSYPIEVRVLDHPMVNAFALPGGQIVVMRGLIEEAENPDEVAAVLAHEIGHVAAHDPTRITLRAAGSAGLLGLFFGDFAGGGMMAVVTDRLLQASYTRDAEAAADSYAHAVLAENGLSPLALSSFFRRMQARHGDVDGPAAAFMSHPRLTTRIAAAEAAAQRGADRAALDAADWAALQRICSDS